MKRARANSGRRRIGIERVAARPDAWAEWLVGTSSHEPSRVDSLTRRSNARLVPCGSVNAGLTDRARNARLPRPFFERSTSFPRTGVRSILRPTYGLAQRAHTMIGGVLYKMAQLYCAN